ncbi:hypothetical protein D3C85_1291680 [compost metagenome]
MPSLRLSQELVALRPRAAMSSEKEVSLEKLFSTRAATKVPAPWRRVSRPSATRPSKALRIVIRDTDSSLARSRSGGRASSGFSVRRSMAWRTACCSC